jgi:hypothetical protein
MSSDIRGEGRASASVDEAAWKAAIGSDSGGYYFDQFAGVGSIRRWHWPAFFVTWYWLLYRKMWGWAVGYFLLPYVLLVVLSVVAAIAPTAAAMLGLLYVLGLFFGPPMLANSLYHSHCAKSIRSVKTGSATREQVLARLEARGGTSAIALILVGLLGGVTVIGVLAAVSIPAYQDYTVRAKTTEAYKAGQELARVVGLAYEASGAIPQSLDRFPQADALPRIVQSVEIDPGNGVISMRLELPGQVSGTMQLVPEIANGKHVYWHCETDLRRGYVPQACRRE